MPFQSLFDMPLVQIEPKPKKAAAKKSKVPKGTGCEFCPANDKPGINKVFARVKGKELFIWGMAPGAEENEAKKEFVGRSGKFLWNELAKVGIERKDVDVANIVRCFPSDDKDGRLQMRDPSKAELKCCSKYTAEDLSKSQARIYLVLGTLAAKTLLGKEYRTGTRIMWSDVLKAKVFCLWHPSYFIRGTAPKEILTEFRTQLKNIATDLGKESLSAYQYLEEQDYKAITTVADAEAEEELILRNAAKGIRLSVDAEDEGNLNLCMGTSFKPGRARVFITDHPLARKVDGKWVPLKKSVRIGIKKVCRRILTNPKIKKIFHYGSYDVPSFKKRLAVDVRGYDWDTLYSSYFYDPNAKSYGLDVVGLRMFPEFGEYKTITLPESLPKDFDKKAAKAEKYTLTQLHDYITARGLLKLSQVPLRKLVLYNGADCDLTKRIELRTKKKANYRLVRLYMDIGFILDEMTPNGPYYDYEQGEKLKLLIPPKLEAVKKRLKKLAGDEDFNFGSYPQVQKLLFETLKIKYPFPLKPGEKKKTDKPVMELLGRKHKVCRDITLARKLSKMKSTYIDSYEECARANNDRLRTKWNLTGTGTGRMSSGGDKAKKKGEETKKVNLQNLHGDRDLQNLSIPDPAWRKLYEALYKAAVNDAPSSVATIERKLVDRADDKELFGYFDDAKNAKVPGLVDQLRDRLLNKERFLQTLQKILEDFGDVKVVMGFDQGQLEVRMMAQDSGDKNLRHDCMSGDIHAKVGHNMTGWEIQKIKKDKKTRTLTKNIHFGILFGLGPNGLMQFILVKDSNATIDEEEAQRLYANYFKAYPGVRLYIIRKRECVELNGYSENIFGFKRPLSKNKDKGDAYASEDSGDGAYWGNQAINGPIQGAAHQLMLMSLSALRRKPKKYRKHLPVPGMEVHDAMVWWIPLKQLVKSLGVAKDMLEKEPLEYVKKYYPDINWTVPLVVEGKVGLRYGDTVECEGLTIEQMLVAMFIETWIAETKLNAELEKAA